MSDANEDLPRLALLTLARLQAEKAEPDPWEGSPYAHLRGIAEGDEDAGAKAYDLLVIALAASGLPVKLLGPGVVSVCGHQVEVVALASAHRLSIPGWLPMPGTTCRALFVLRPPTHSELYAVAARPRGAEECGLELPSWCLGGDLEEGIKALVHLLNKEDARLAALKPQESR